ncbi:glutaredoxin 2 [Falsirhodobacter deserti]|uniref:glutaredoxin 2 n=1 Tax=Falsirhodobacter deserti TaxID=1365611 RepID=UPI000FE39C1E|nr:glutaredoxin 2 [Falsirhodobacter deserti]
MKLYIYEHCPFCARARLAFGLKGVAHDTEIIMEGDAETPTRLIGKKAVPILQKDDGTHMAESLDIVHRVDRLGVPMFDGPPDARLDAAGDGLWKAGLPLFIPRFTKGNFAELATPEAREAYRRREEKAFGDLEALMSDTPALLAAIAPKMEALAPLVDGRTEIGISDIKLWPILRSLSIVKDLPFPTPVRAYAEVLSAKGRVPLLFEQAM